MIDLSPPICFVVASNLQSYLSESMEQCKQVDGGVLVVSTCALGSNAVQDLLLMVDELSRVLH